MVEGMAPITKTKLFYCSTHVGYIIILCNAQQVVIGILSIVGSRVSSWHAHNFKLYVKLRFVLICSINATLNIK